MIISTIISAHNEESRISKVLQPVNESQLVNEIIVIDDGSTDDTKTVAASFPKVKVIVNQECTGKNPSLAKGILISSGSILLFLDADLVNLSVSDVDNLISPVLNNEADMTISYRGGDPFFSRYILPSSSFTSGERCLHKNDYYQVDGLKEARALEFDMLCNRYFLKHKKRVGIVVLNKLQNIMKWKKVGLFKGWLGEIKPTLDLIKTLGLIDLLYQIFILGYCFQFKRLFSGKNLIFVN